MSTDETTVDRLGRYEVIRTLGKGAMGVVYLGRDPVIGRLVALKTIRVGVSSDEDEAREFQERFVREAQAAGILNHPSIVTVHDIGQDADQDVSFIAMEYVEGRNLRELILGRELPGYDDLAEILAQVAEALDFAHLKGIVHRDVKPANIIVCDGVNAKITDFGIAKIATESANLTSTGQFLGTPNYMAPEQVKGKAVDGRTDLFAFGVVLFESLTGKKPFAGDSLTAISYKIVHEPFPPPRTHNPASPRGFDPILAKCLAKEPSLRYQRGRDLAADLRKVAESLRAEYTSHVDELPEAQETRVKEAMAAATVELPRPSDSEIHEDLSVFDELTGDISDSARRLASKARDELAKAVRGVTPKQGFKTRIPMWLAATITLTLVGLVSWWGWSIKSQIIDVLPTDSTLETLVEERRIIANEARRLLRDGELQPALDKYKRLQEIAPDNAWVGGRIEEIETQLRVSSLEKRRKALARSRFESGKKGFDSGDYHQASLDFQDAFSLDPNLAEDPGLYLRLSSERQTLQRLVGTTGPIPPAEKAGVVVRFPSPVADGFVAVSANRRTVVREDLWQMRSGFVEGRGPRTVTSYRSVAPGETNLVVEVSVPSLKFRDLRRYHVELIEAALYELTLALDRPSKTLTVSLTLNGKEVEQIVDEPPPTEE